MPGQLEHQSILLVMERNEQFEIAFIEIPMILDLAILEPSFDLGINGRLRPYAGTSRCDATSLRLVDNQIMPNLFTMYSHKNTNLKYNASALLANLTASMLLLTSLTVRRLG
jgi:hypothetical protein